MLIFIDQFHYLVKHISDEMSLTYAWYAQGYVVN